MKEVKKPIIFEEITKYSEPYNYFHIKNVLTEDFAEKLLTWFEETSNFVSHHEDNLYRNSVFHISSDNIPRKLESYLTLENLTEIKKVTEEAFDTKFQKKFILSVHRYIAGEGVMIHNDFLEKENRDEHFFSHRLLIYFNRGWKEENGGVLGIFSSKNTTDLRNTIAPLHNTGVGLEFSEKSWHAVSAIESGVRYALIFNFANKENLYKNEIIE